MSDTPTYASLLTRLFSGSAADRATALNLLMQDPAQAQAVEQDVRDRLRDEYPWNRTVAAETVLRVYGDRAAAIDALAGVLKQGDPAASSDTVAVIQQLGADGIPLAVLMARHTPDAFANGPPDEFYRWVGAEATHNGPAGVANWLELVKVEGPPRVRIGLMMGLADAAPAVTHDLAATEHVLWSYLKGGPCRYAAAAALWRVNWRLNRVWLDGFDAVDPTLVELLGLRVLVLTVLVEQLGRKPAVAGAVRDLLTVPYDDEPATAGEWLVERNEMIRRLARLGMRGWGVLLPMLSSGQPGTRYGATDGVRRVIYDAALERPAVLPLIHHYAHRIVAAGVVEGPSGRLLAAGLVQPATQVLEQLGPAAGTAVPDLLALACKVPEVAGCVEAALLAVAGGYPNTAAAIVRALHRLGAAAPLGDGQLLGFQALCRVLGKLAPDTGPRLAENTAVDLGVAELVIRQPGWKDAPPETRRQHATILADLLGDPRAEVRLRAAELLRHYPDQLSAVWPALVAALTGADEKLAARLLWHFGRLDAAADAVTAELVALFRETNPVYAARAVVALWRMGRMPAIGDELRKVVEADPETGWGWGVLRGVIDRIAAAHGMLGELTDIFAASPAAVAARVQALIDAIESPEEARLSAHIPTAGATTPINWEGVHACVNSDPLGLFVYVALLLEYGSTGYSTHKVWLIKNLRVATGMGLAEAKRAIESVAARITNPGASVSDRGSAVRECFGTRPDLPGEFLKLLEHPINWYRWAGLELADAWGLSAEQVKEITRDRVHDGSARVRERAMRMARG